MTERKQVHIWRSFTGYWRIIRKHDGQPIGGDFATEAEARAWAVGHGWVVVEEG